MSHTRLATCLVVSLAGALLTATARAEDYSIYSNGRFGATAEVPRSWKPLPPPENGDGLNFVSPDGTASITVSGILNVDETPALAMKNEATPGDGETVTYRQVGARSVTLSGTKGDKIFYRRSLLVCRDQIWNHVSIEYPAARRAEYDALVGRVSRSLRFSGQSDQIPTCR